MIDDLYFSRPKAVASNLGEDAPDRYLFQNKRILLTAESAILGTENGQSCFWSSLLLMIRVCSNVDISLPGGSDKLKNRYLSDLKDLDSLVIPKFLDEEVRLSDYDAILNVGKTARTDLPWTVINSNGWLLRISSGQEDISDICDQPNPVSALAAACLGVTEVFKRLIKLRDDRGSLFGRLEYSLYSYNREEADFGPELPGRILSDILVTGAGAIGNGLIYLLGLLPIKGHISIVDAQEFQPENFGTCLLVGKRAIGRQKAIFVEEYLNSRNISAKGYSEKIEEFSMRLGREVPYPKIVINGLDNIAARRAVQDIWPDIIIDGATSDLICQVSRHPWGEDVACLKCLFREYGSKSADEVESQATGLSPERIKNPLEIVTEEDIRVAPEEKKNFLRQNIGKQICSVIQEGVMQQISKEKQAPGFSPSAPFVACFSACMVLAELIKVASGFSSSLEPRFQFDILRGPTLGMLVPQQRSKDCICVARKKNIELIRSKRSSR